jgi:hypothetical protein
MNKKAGVPIPITLFVLMVLVLAGASIFILYNKGEGVKAELYSVKCINFVYIAEEKYEFYIEQDFDEDDALEFIGGRLDKAERVGGSIVVEKDCSYDKGGERAGFYVRYEFFGEGS